MKKTSTTNTNTPWRTLGGFMLAAFMMLSMSGLLGLLGPVPVAQAHDGVTNFPLQNPTGEAGLGCDPSQDGWHFILNGIDNDGQNNTQTPVGTAPSHVHIVWSDTPAGQSEEVSLSPVPGDLGQTAHYLTNSHNRLADVISGWAPLEAGVTANNFVMSHKPCKASPTISTEPSPGGVVGVVVLNDTATLSGGNNPTGTITFNLYGPSDPTCTGTPTFSVTLGTVGVAISGATTTTGPVANAAGTWNWIATYNGDELNNTATHACGVEAVTVLKARPTLVTLATPSPQWNTSISDTAALSGGYNPTGSISFTVTPPAGSATPAGTRTVAGNGNYTSDTVTASLIGTYQWAASYSGDANNEAAVDQGGRDEQSLSSCYAYDKTFTITGAGKSQGSYDQLNGGFWSVWAFYTLNGGSEISLQLTLTNAGAGIGNLVFSSSVNVGPAPVDLNWRFEVHSDNTSNAGSLLFNSGLLGLETLANQAPCAFANSAVSPVSVGNLGKFEDLEGDGSILPEIDVLLFPLSGWEIVATPSLGAPLTFITGPDGLAPFDLDGLLSWTICETAQAGWAQTYPAPVCYSVPVDAPDNNYLFGNFHIARITVNKVTIGGTTGSFQVTLSGSGTILSTNPNLVAAGGSVGFDVYAGTYTATETAQNGWDETGNTCGSVVVPPNLSGQGGLPSTPQVIECTITNTKWGRIVVRKETVGGDTNPITVFPILLSGTGTIKNSRDCTNVDTGSSSGVGAISTQCAQGYSMTAGTYSVAESAVDGWTLGTNGCLNQLVEPGATVTCTITNNKQSKIIVQKRGTGSTSVLFPFNTTGPGYAGAPAFSLSIGQDNTSPWLNADSYSVMEDLTALAANWELTDVQCLAVGPGGSSAIVANPSASITLGWGDTVTCTFVNAQRNLATRTIGYWATHWQYAQSILNGAGDGPSLGGTIMVCDAADPDVMVDSTSKLMGGFWANIAKKSTGVNRINIDKNRMVLLQQLLGAILNNAAFGSSPDSFGTSIAAGKAAFCTGSANAIKTAAYNLDAFNKSGDAIGGNFAGINADAKGARALAASGIPYWDDPNGNLP